MQSAFPDRCGDLPFIIQRDGTWLHEGRPIERPEFVRLFASILQRDASGAYWLQTPAERGRIVVVDTPFLAIDMQCRGSGASQTITFRTNLDEWVEAGAEHPLSLLLAARGRTLSPTIVLRPGSGAFPLEARITQAVYYDLANLAVPHTSDDGALHGVWSNGCFFAMGSDDEPDQAS